MGFGSRMTAAALLGVGTLLAGAAAHAQAKSQYEVDITQVGNNVVATGSGSIDTNSLSYLTSTPFGQGGNLYAFFQYWSVGYSSANDIYQGLSETTGGSFMSSGEFYSSVDSGGNVSIQDVSGPYVSVPAGYVSDTLISNSSIYDNTTIAGLNLISGTYVWSWGGGTITLNIESVPEPGSLALIGLPLIAFGLMRHMAGKREAV